MNSKSVSQTFKILFQTEDINIFVLCGIFFSRFVSLKSSFSDEKKTSVVKYEAPFSKKALDKKRGKGKFHHLQKLKFFRVIHNVKLR